MKSQFQFFMLESDEVEFVNFGLNICDSIDKKSDIQWFFSIGDCRIQLLRSRKYENEIISGVISIQTSGYGLKFESSGSAEKIYIKMKNWLKKTYRNNMTCKNINLSGNRHDINYFWYSQNVKAIIESNPSIELKQIKGAPVIFEIKKEA